MNDFAEIEKLCKIRIISKPLALMKWMCEHTGWRMKCHAIDCARNTFLLLQKHLTKGGQKM